MIFLFLFSDSFSHIEEKSVSDTLIITVSNDELFAL